MIQFNELRITPDGKHLIIDISVLSMSYYDDVYLDAIYIDTQDTFVETGPSSKAIYTETISENTKHVRKYIDIDTIGDNLFFVWVATTGDPTEDTPCGCKDPLVLGVVYDKYPIYTQAMKYINGLDACSPAKEFIDFILRKDAFELCIKTGNYSQAIKYWKKFYSNVSQTVTTNCGCNGVFN